MNENPLPSPEFEPEQPQKRSGLSARTASIIAALALVAVCLGVRTLFHKPLMGGDMNREVTESFESVRVEGVSCDVKFYFGGSDVCSVDYRGPSRMSCSVEVKNGTLVIEEKTARRLLSILSLGSLRGSSLDVFLPELQYSRLELETVSGDIEVPAGGSFREADLSTVSGDITFSERVDGPMTVESVSGDIRITGSSVQSLRVSSTSGEQYVDDTRIAGRAVFESISGNISVIASDADSLEFSTVSGDVSTRLLSAKDYHTSTTSGTVTVLPSMAGQGRCDISTVSGDIICE